jgi:cytochrome b subunit of formate dehydrogenase
MDAPTTLVRLASPWEGLYSNSKGLEIFVTFLHVGGLLLAGGLALATDRATLRAIRQAVHDRAQHLEALSSVHQTVLAGLGITFVSGLLLFFSDVKTFWGSWVFWLKMALIAALLINGWIMTRAERSLRGSDMREDDRAWTHLHNTAEVSLVLWYAITLAGIALVNMS